MVHMSTYMSEERAHLYRLRKKSKKNEFLNRRNLSVAFDRAILNIHKNNIFPTLACDMLKFMIWNTNSVIIVSVSK
jgi:hypothetical protein